MIAPAGKTLQSFLFAATISVLNNFYQAYASYYTISAAESFQQFLQKSHTARGQKLTEAQLLWLWSVHLNALTIGNILGPFCTPWFCERLGRKKTLLVSNLGIFVAVSLSTGAIHFLLPELFLFSRIFGAALSSLNFGAQALFMTEFPPTHLRGLMFFISGFSYNIVANLGMLLGMDALLGRNLEALVGLGILPSLLAVFCTIPLRETPKFLLLNRQDKDKAREALHYYQGPSIDHEAVLAQILKEQQQQQGERRRPLLVLLREVFTKRHLRLATLLGCCSLQLVVGIWPIATTLFAVHFSLQQAQIFSSVCSALSLVANLPGTIMSNRVSRRSLLLSMGVLNSTCIVCYAVSDRLALLYPAFRYGCLISMVLYFMSFGVSIGTIPFYISGELFPQQFRSTGQSLVFFVSLCMSFAFNIFTLPAYSAIGVYAFFALFTLPQCLCLTILWLYLPETQGREISEIVEELKRPRRGQRSRKVIDASASKAEC